MVQNANNSGSLGERIQQGQPFPSIHVEGFLTLMRTGNLLAEQVSPPLRARGLTLQQYNILRILRGSQGGLLMHEAAERMVSRAASITRLVDRLEVQGWLTRVRCEKDRRAIYIRLTPAGSEMLGELEAPVIETIDRAARGLTDLDMQRLCDLLNQLRSPLEDENPAPDSAKTRKE